jgi:hypothetical protein
MKAWEGSPDHYNNTIMATEYYNVTARHIFDFWYKWTPQGFNCIGDLWPNETIPGNFLGGADNIGLTSGFYNMGIGYYANTRSPAIIRPQYQTSSGVLGGGAASIDERALPWGSSAIDYLWNVQNISSSIGQLVVPGTPTAADKTCYTRITFAYNTSSFNYHNWKSSGVISFTGNYGLSSYPVTSSWTVYEPKLNANVGGYATYKVVPIGLADRFFPATDGNIEGGYLKPYSRDYSTPSYAEKPFYGSTNGVGWLISQFGNPPTLLQPGFNPTNLTYDNNQTGSFDGRFYDLTGGCGITRDAIKASMQLYDANANINSVAGLAAKSTALKNRRLFFPTIVTGSSNRVNSNPIGTEWLYGINGGQGSDIYFTENGGIYNVKFNLKRDLDNDYYPDQGAAELLIYIHNINTTVPASSDLTPGASGWLPPENNIVRVKNNPAMSFLNPATGFQIETFNINLVQYGVPAQLVFEASGSLDTDEYFGCVIDDVNFCKVGVSTDPDLIKPETSADNIYQQQGDNDR